MISATRGSAILISLTFISLVLNYIFNVGLGWLLKPEGYGVYGVAIAALGILSILVSSGFPWAVAKYLSENIEKDIKRKVFKTSLICNFLIALSLSVLLLSIHYLYLSLGRIYFQVLVLIVLILITGAFKEVYRGGLQGFFKIKELGKIGIIALVIKVSIGLGLVYLGYGAFGALTGILASTILSLVLMMYVIRYFNFLGQKGFFEIKTIKFTLPVFFGLLSLTLIQNLDILSVKLLTPRGVSDQLAGYYQSALVLGRIPFFMVGGLMMALFPFISRDSKNKNYSLITIRYAFLFVIPISVAIAAKPDAFISLVFPETYLQGAKVLGIIAIAMGFLALVQILTQTFQALGRPEIPVKILFFSVGIQLTLLVILVPKMGIVGAAVSTTMACAFGLLMLSYSYLRFYDLRLDIKGGMLLIVAYLVLALFIILLPTYSRAETIVSIFVASFIYLSTLALLKLLREEDVARLCEALPRTTLVQKIVAHIAGIVRRVNGLL